MECQASAKHERKVVLIGGLVTLGVGILALALADYLLAVMDYGFMVILFAAFIACFGFFDRAYTLVDLGRKYAMITGFRRDKITKESRPKFRFKNATFRAAYDEINSANVTIGQIVKYIKPTNTVSSKPVTILDTPAPTESTNATQKCPDCAAELPITAKFCNKCGHKF